MTAFTSQPGKVFWRGTFLPRQDAEPLLERLNHDAEAQDYFASDAKNLARELRQAMALAYHKEAAE